MKRLIFQVYVGKPSNLYDHCVKSVGKYCLDHDIDHVVLREPKLKIRPDPFASNRSKEAVERLGYLLPLVLLLVGTKYVLVRFVPNSSRYQSS